MKPKGEKMLKEKLYLKLADGTEREIPESEIVSIKPFIRLKQENKMTMAGEPQEYFLVKTKTESLEILRYPDFPENDKEVLDFIFANCNIRIKPDIEAVHNF